MSLNWCDYAASALTDLDYAKADPDILFAPQAMLDAGRNYERANSLEDAAHTWEALLILIQAVTSFRRHFFGQGSPATAKLSTTKLS